MSELLAIVSDERDGRRVWSVRGEIDLASAAHFEQQILAGGLDDPVVVVDLVDVRYLDSAGLASLARLHVQLSREGRALRLVVDDRCVAGGSLRLAGLDLVIALFATVEDALGAEH